MAESRDDLLVVVVALVESSQPGVCFNLQWSWTESKTKAGVSGYGDYFAFSLRLLSNFEGEGSVTTASLNFCSELIAGSIRVVEIGSYQYKFCSDL